MDAVSTLFRKTMSITRGPQEFKNYPGSIFFVKALNTPPPLPPSKYGMFFFTNLIIYMTKLSERWRLVEVAASSLNSPLPVDLYICSSFCCPLHST